MQGHTGEIRVGTESGTRTQFRRLPSRLSKSKRPPGDGFKMLPGEFRGHSPKPPLGAPRDEYRGPRTQGSRAGSLMRPRTLLEGYSSCISATCNRNTSMLTLLQCPSRLVRVALLSVLDIDTPLRNLRCRREVDDESANRRPIESSRGSSGRISAPYPRGLYVPACA